MQDNERYPTVVEPSTLEVLGRPDSHSQTPPLKDDKILAGRIPPASTDQTREPSKRIFGLRKTTFWLVVALVVVVIGGAVGGAVGGTLGAKTSHATSPASTASSTTTSLATNATTIPTSSVTNTTTTASSTTSATPTAINRPVERLAVSSLLNNSSKPMMLALFYQDVDNGSIMYTLWTPDTSWTQFQAASLSIAPQNGTPITATSLLISSDDTSKINIKSNKKQVYQLNLFYLTVRPDIVMANISCSISYLTCSTSSISIISTNLPSPIHPSSGLGGAFLGLVHGWTWRLYFSDINGYLYELDGDKSWTAGWHTNLMPQCRVLNGSAITVTMDTTRAGGMNVFYVDATSKLLSTIVYDHGWQNIPTTLSTSPPQQWDPTSDIAAAFQIDPGLFRTFYVGTNKEVYEQYEVNGTWTAQSNQSSVWSYADRAGAGIAALGWLDQIRLYYFSNNNSLVEEVLSGSTWSQGNIW